MRPLLLIFARSAGFNIQLCKKLSFSSSRALCSSINGDSKMSGSLLTDDLRSQRVTIGVNSGNVTLDAVVQDSMPGGSKVGTVVASHGVPGSHKDFKYLQAPLKDAGIRFIGINFPGFGYTPDSTLLQHINQERSDFVQAVVDRLNVQGAVVFMGHSRGSENALRMGARNADRCAGVLLVNPIGLRPHRGIRPLSVINAITFLWDLGWITQLFLRPFLHWVYNSVLKFRVPTGDQAALCIRLVTNAELSSQQPIIEELNSRPDVAVVVAYGGSDPLIEREISHELAAALHAVPEVVCDADGHDDSTVSQEVERLLREGQTHVAVRFDKVDHFLQKHRAVFLADTIHAMLSNTNKI